MSMPMKKLTRALVPLALALSLQPGHAQAIFGDFGAPAWSRMSKYLEVRLGNLAKDEVALILPVATDAAWDADNEDIRLMEMHKWGDWVPSNAFSYSANSNKRVSDGYRYFLNAAFIAAVDANGTASPQLKNSMKRASEEVEYTRALYNQMVAEADAAYGLYFANTPISRRTDKAKFFKDQGYDVQITARHKRLVDALATLKIVNAALVDPDIDMLTVARIRYDNPNQQKKLPPVPEALNNRDLWESRYISYVDKDIREFKKQYVPETQNIQESYARSEYFEQKWRASLSVSFLGLFRAGGASAEQVRREQHIKQNATRIDISFDNLGTFNIVRGEWFSQNVIDRFASKLDASAWTTMWGPNGQLEMIPKSMLVGRGMTFTVYADQQSIDYMYEHFHGGADAGFSIGYWRIGGGGSFSSTKEQTTVQKYADRITFTDLSGRAKVLGVLAKQYGLSVPRPAPLAFNATTVQREAAAREVRALWSKPDLATQMRGVISNQTIQRLSAE